MFRYIVLGHRSVLSLTATATRSFPIRGLRDDVHSIKAEHETTHRLVDMVQRVKATCRGGDTCVRR
uniref:AlNc14C174G8088 protein n=1 Tax=Albugo laibachii Nc14 TaxID=890382 RepID=F0WNS9_9STRA|nr:AlNc14C174G8088 [Albugo laibachii Nc14]|eukprot:CCA22971.1 AlNc14C174G8088 [Albugo laibachii Nc14]